MQKAPEFASQNTTLSIMQQKGDQKPNPEIDQVELEFLQMIG